jgi:hypothetical protein
MWISEQSHMTPYESEKFQYNVQRRFMVIKIIKAERYVKDQYVNQRKNRSGKYRRQGILSMNWVTVNPNAEVTYLIISNGIPVSELVQLSLYSDPLGAGRSEIESKVTQNKM